MTTFDKLKIGDAFQLCDDGPVFVKVRGGCRPGRGGALYKVAPTTLVISFGRCV